MNRNGGVLWSLFALAALVGLIALIRPDAADAGPPFSTDDAEPTDTGHWEIYNFASGADDMGRTAGQAGLDLNYGGYKDVQLTAVIPLDYQAGASGAVGMGDVQLAVKYRFLHQTDGGWAPEAAIFPRLFVPTAGRGLESNRVTLLLPIWGEKDIGKWSVFGGGGYDINPGPGRRDYWISGLAVQRSVNKRLSLGLEVFHQTPDSSTSLAVTDVNVGVTYKLAEHWSLLTAGGPGVENPRQSGRYDFYVALKADY